MADSVDRSTLKTDWYCDDELYTSEDGSSIVDPGCNDLYVEAKYYEEAAACWIKDSAMVQSQE